jgi:hypothetical protein
MKFVLLTAAVFSFAFMNIAQEKKEVKTEEKKEVKSKKEKSPITFTTVVIERKDIPYGTDDMFEFEFKNTGKSPLTIQNVQTSCGCTTAEKPTAPVMPKKSSKIIVNYDTKRVGHFTKTITIKTDAQEEPIILTIKGNVLPQEKESTTPAPKNEESH